MRKVIFVGIHNKKGKKPLDSSTKTGKLVDAIIAQIAGVTVIKSNLFVDHIPIRGHWPREVVEWKKRTGYGLFPGDIVLALGADVSKVLKMSSVCHIPLRHPASVWSNENQRLYVDDAIKKIIEYIK